jgi:biotin synthase
LTIACLGKYNYLVMKKQQVFKLWQKALRDPQTLYKAADELRRRHFGSKVELCWIINAKSGDCGQDCAFCSQSARHKTDIPRYPLVSADDMVESSRKAAKAGAYGFGIVTSGDCISTTKELDTICEAVERIKKEGLVNPDASLGRLTPYMARQLKAAGLVRYHHNLETSEGFFPKICTTHSYDDRVNTVRIAKEAGLEVCCGGLFGIGETVSDRIDLAFMLKELDVDSVPLNFLIPIAGTPLEDATPLTANEILMTIAVFRIVLPDKQIKVCAGREISLRERQRQIFQAGASGMMVGGYLTQGGNSPREDLKMLDELGLVPTGTG